MGKIYERRLKQPTPNVSVADVILNKLRENSNRVYAIDGSTGNRMTYRELLQKSVKFAKFLQKIGIKIGDTIGIATENRLNWFIPVYASIYLGAIVAPYNPIYTEYEFLHILNIAKPRIVFVSQRTENLIAKILPKLSWKMDLIQLDNQPLTPNVRTLTNILNNESDVDYMRYKPVEIDDPSRHPSVILCSSGTTARIGIKCVRNGYGMTELSMATNLSGRDDDDNEFENLGCGQIFPGFLGKVVDPETQETLEAGEVGEICYLGDQVMLGYWNNPEMTRQIIDQDGWLHTGDIGYFDNKERLHVIDRAKELIKYKGSQVSPSEIETVLLSHPAVKDAAVAAKSDERNGEVPAAFVVKQPGATITAQDLQEFVKQKLSTHKWLHGGVQFVDVIPKNPSGKILRRELRVMISKL
ncbi:PREDICTED: luciferin 4-monooxygenase-like [Wasmannia auropunctata]|uniref:luciferin 4-monooxygenase-like n=1 Tax=Wasmannia auropunctata TaxID=64793 RepID=UPI0005EDA82F|nr:PREDICTED: luciferin 4-monooxygenase-like [Wasmannia auropunctata]